MDFTDSKNQSFEALHASVLKKAAVDCATIDTMLKKERIPLVDFLKLDCEGAELRCLNGAQKAISKNKVLMIYSEFVAFNYYQDHATLADQLQFLQSVLLRVFQLMNHNILHVHTLNTF